MHNDAAREEEEEGRQNERRMKGRQTTERSIEGPRQTDRERERLTGREMRMERKVCLGCAGRRVADVFVDREERRNEIRTERRREDHPGCTRETQRALLSSLTQQS